MREKINNIKAVIDWLEKELAAYGADAKTIRNTVLAVEELLLLYKDKLQNDDIDIKIDVIRKTKKFSVKMSVLAPEFSPETLETETGIDIFDRIIKKTGFTVDYSYSGGINQTEIVIKKYSGFIRNFWFSFKFIKRKSTVFIAFAAHMISIVANLLIPIVTGRLIVDYTEKIVTQILLTAAALMVSKILYESSFGVANILYTKASYYSENDIRKELVDKMFFIKNSNYLKNGTGTFIQRGTTDLEIISAGITSLLNMVSESMYYIGALIATALLDYRVFVAEIFMLAIMLIMEKRRAYWLEIDRRKTINMLDRLSGGVIDYVNGISEVKLLNAKETFSKRISDFSEQRTVQAHLTNRNTRIRIIASSSFIAIFSFLIMLFMGYDLQKGIITVPTALILFNYLTIIDRPILVFINNSIDFCNQFNLAAERVRDLYEGSEFEHDTFGDLHIDKLYGDIVFDNVTFAYNHDDLGVPDNDIIKCASFNIKRGETVALVGRSGSGKTTFLRLLSHQVDCYSGKITIDGNSISDLDRDSIYNNISVISQSTVLFNCSIKENLLLAKPDATMEELKTACEKACILEDIERTENGFDTELGERGARFSGGQRQRLAIARALLRNTDILLLDEATSAMDNITQGKIMDTINNIGKSHTVIIIAHRLSTIKNADKILLVGDKKILASGTHEEMMKNCEEYRNLYRFEDTKEFELIPT